MIHNNNQGGGGDPINTAAWSSASAMSSWTMQAGRISGELIGICSAHGIKQLVKLDILLFGHWRRRLAAIYDSLGFKFLG